MAEIAESTITISQSVGDVYNFLVDVENIPLFWDKIESVELASGDGGVGTVYNLISPTILGGKKKSAIEITAKTAHQNFEYKNAQGDPVVLTGYNLEIADGKTRVTLYMKNNLGALANILTLSALSAKDEKKDLDQVVLNLKSLLEGGLFTPS